MKTPSYFIFLFILFSCRENPKTTEQDNKPITIDLKKSTVPNKSTAIKNIEYIPLETDENILINLIDEIIFHNDKFYILDLTASTIFIFNRDGSFYNKLSKIGKGPGEYLHIMDFDINTANNSIWIYDNHSSKIIIYNELLTEFEEIKLKYYFEEFVIKNNEEIYTRNIYSDGIIHSRIAELNISNMAYRSIFVNSAYEDGFDITRFGNILHKNINGVLVNPRFKGDIFRIENGTTNKIVEFIGNFPDKSFVAELKQNLFLMNNPDKYITNIGNIFENSSYIHFRIQEKETLSIVLDKKSGDALLLDFLNQENYFGNHMVYGVAEDKFISLYNTTEYSSSEHFKNRVEKSSLNNTQKELLLGRSFYDNPMLILFDLTYK